jgi:hypothetical protein
MQGDRHVRRPSAEADDLFREDFFDASVTLRDGRCPAAALRQYEGLTLVVMVLL